MGHLTIRGQRAEYLGSLPFDAAWGVLTGVRTGAFKYLYMSGDAVNRGSAKIGYVSFDAAYDPDDFAE